jgi:hypothetical protein
MGVLWYLYRWSKDPDFYAVTYRITNDPAATYATFPPLGATAAGADISSFGIGMLHSFSVTVAKGSHRGKSASVPPPAPASAPASAPAPGSAPAPAPAPAPSTDPNAAPAPVLAPPPRPNP